MHDRRRHSTITWAPTVCCGLFLVSACSFPTKTRIVSSTDTTTLARDSRQTNFLRTRNHYYETPSYLLDEAVITKLDASEVCIDFVQNTDAGIDQPLSEWDVEVGGKPVVVVEGASDSSYWESTRRVHETVVLAESEDASLRVTQPVELSETNGYVSRNGRVCAPLQGPPKEVRLEIVLKPSHPGSLRWGQIYVWNFEPA